MSSSIEMDCINIGMWNFTQGLIELFYIIIYKLLHFINLKICFILLNYLFYFIVIKQKYKNTYCIN